MESLKLVENVYWLGIQDHDLEVFDVVMETKYGTSYNSYFVKGEDKVALFDTVKAPYFEDYLQKFKNMFQLIKSTISSFIIQSLIMQDQLKN